MSWLVTFEAYPEICTRSLIKVGLLQQQIILITILSIKSEGTPNEYLQLTFLWKIAKIILELSLNTCLN